MPNAPGSLEPLNDTHKMANSRNLTTALPFPAPHHQTLFKPMRPSNCPCPHPHRSLHSPASPPRNLTSVEGSSATKRFPASGP